MIIRFFLLLFAFMRANFLFAMDENLSTTNEMKWHSFQPSRTRQLARWKNLTQPKISILKCPVCMYEDGIESYSVLKALDIFNAGELIRYVCPKCELIFGDMRFLSLSSQEINEDYEDLYSYYCEGDNTRYVLSVLSQLNIDRSKKILDYACGKWNNIIPIYRAKGFDIQGYDKYVSTGCYVTDSLPKEKFDIVYNVNFIEHLVDPYKQMEEILSLCHENSVVYFITSCFEYCIEFTHYHTLFFSDKSLSILMEKFGYSQIYSNKQLFHDGQFFYIKGFSKSPT